MIKKIIIKNFKSIKNLEFDLNLGVTVLTGMNNSGKTNIMEAINVMVNDEYYPSKVSESFYFSENEPESSSFEISAVLNVENFDNWINNSSKSSVKVSIVQDWGESFVWQDKPSLATRLKNRDLTIVKSLQRDNTKQYTEKIYFTDHNDVKYEFEGYNFLSLVYPGAGLGTDKSAKGSLLTYKTSWFGKLIDSVIDDEKKKRISEMNKRIINNKEFQALEKEITEGFFGTEQNLIPSILGIDNATISYIPSERNIRTSFDVKVNDGKEEKIENKSTGTQFVTVIELFLNYINKFNKSGILSIDEIESTLHPSVAKKVVSIASKKVNQLIFTTHSKDLLRVVPFANIIKVYKNNNETKTKVLYNKAYKLYPLIYQWPEVFFNDQLIVCEGKETSLVEALISSDPGLSKKAASLNLDVINGNGGAVSSFIKHVEQIDKSVNCSFIYDFEYLSQKKGDGENFGITKKMMKLNGANDADVAKLESFETFVEQKEFLERFRVFIMIKHNKDETGGIEQYYLQGFPNVDIKEVPLFLATKLFENKKIDEFFDSKEYIDVLYKIIFNS